MAYSETPEPHGLPRRKSTAVPGAINHGATGKSPCFLIPRRRGPFLPFLLPTSPLFFALVVAGVLLILATPGAAQVATTTVQCGNVCAPGGFADENGCCQCRPGFSGADCDVGADVTLYSSFPPDLEFFNGRHTYRMASPFHPLGLHIAVTSTNTDMTIRLTMSALDSFADGTAASNAQLVLHRALVSPPLVVQNVNINRGASRANFSTTASGAGLVSNVVPLGGSVDLVIPELADVTGLKTLYLVFAPDGEWPIDPATGALTTALTVTTEVTVSDSLAMWMLLVIVVLYLVIFIAPFVVRKKFPNFWNRLKRKAVGRRGKGIEQELEESTGCWRFCARGSSHDGLKELREKEKRTDKLNAKYLGDVLEYFTLINSKPKELPSYAAARKNWTKRYPDLMFRNERQVYDDFVSAIKACKGLPCREGFSEERDTSTGRARDPDLPSLREAAAFLHQILELLSAERRPGQPKPAATALVGPNGAGAGAGAGAGGLSRAASGKAAIGPGALGATDSRRGGPPGLLARASSSMRKAGSVSANASSGGGGGGIGGGGGGGGARSNYGDGAFGYDNSSEYYSEDHFDHYSLAADDPNPAVARAVDRVTGAFKGAFASLEGFWASAFDLDRRGGGDGGDDDDDDENNNNGGTVTTSTRLHVPRDHPSAERWFVRNPLRQLRLPPDQGTSRPMLPQDEDDAYADIGAGSNPGDTGMSSLLFATSSVGGSGNSSGSSGPFLVSEATAAAAGIATAGPRLVSMFRRVHTSDWKCPPIPLSEADEKLPKLDERELVPSVSIGIPDEINDEGQGDGEDDEDAIEDSQLDQELDKIFNKLSSAYNIPTADEGDAANGNVNPSNTDAADDYGGHDDHVEDRAFDRGRAPRGGRGMSHDSQTDFADDTRLVFGRYPLFGPHLDRTSSMLVGADAEGLGLEIALLKSLAMTEPTEPQFKATRRNQMAKLSKSIQKQLKSAVLAMQACEMLIADVSRKMSVAAAISRDKTDYDEEGNEITIKGDTMVLTKDRVLRQAARIMHAQHFARRLRRQVWKAVTALASVPTVADFLKADLKQEQRSKVGLAGRLLGRGQDTDYDAMLVARIEPFARVLPKPAPKRPMPGLMGSGGMTMRKTMDPFYTEFLRFVSTRAGRRLAAHLARFPDPSRAGEAHYATLAEPLPAFAIKKGKGGGTGGGNNENGVNDDDDENDVVGVDYKPVNKNDPKAVKKAEKEAKKNAKKAEKEAKKEAKREAKNNAKGKGKGKGKGAGIGKGKLVKVRLANVRVPDLALVHSIDMQIEEVTYVMMELLNEFYISFGMQLQHCPDSFHNRVSVPAVATLTKLMRVGDSLFDIGAGARGEANLNAFAQIADGVADFCDLVLARHKRLETLCRVSLVEHNGTIRVIRACVDLFPLVQAVRDAWVYLQKNFDRIEAKTREEGGRDRGSDGEDADESSRGRKRSRRKGLTPYQDEALKIAKRIVKNVDKVGRKISVPNLRKLLLSDKTLPRMATPADIIDDVSASMPKVVKDPTYASDFDSNSFPTLLSLFRDAWIRTLAHLPDSIPRGTEDVGSAADAGGVGDTKSFRSALKNRMRSKDKRDGGSGDGDDGDDEGGFVSRVTDMWKDKVSAKAEEAKEDMINNGLDKAQEQTGIDEIAGDEDGEEDGDEEGDEDGDGPGLGISNPADEAMGSFKALLGRIAVVIMLHVGVAVRAAFVTIKLTTDIAFMWHLAHSLPGIPLPSDKALLAVAEQALANVPLLNKVIPFWMNLIFVILRNINLPELVGGWNCGGLLFLALPMMLGVAMVIIYSSIEGNLLVATSIGIKNLSIDPVTGQARNQFLSVLIERVSEVVTTIVLFVMQSLIASLAALVLNSVVQTGERTCSSLDKAILYASWPIAITLALISACLAMLIFSGRDLMSWAAPLDGGRTFQDLFKSKERDEDGEAEVEDEHVDNLTKVSKWFPTGDTFYRASGQRGHPDKHKSAIVKFFMAVCWRTAWVLYRAFGRILLCTFGIWTNSSVIAYDVLKRAYLFNFGDEEDNQHANIIALLGQANGLFWLILPYGVFLTKLQEIVNAPPIFTFCHIDPTSWRDDFQFPCFQRQEADAGGFQPIPDNSGLQSLTAQIAQVLDAKKKMPTEGGEGENGEGPIDIDNAIKSRVSGMPANIDDPHDEADSIGFDQMGFSVSVRAAPPKIDRELMKKIQDRLKRYKTEVDDPELDRLRLELLVLMEMGPLDLQASLLRRCMEWISSVCKYAALLLVLFQNEESSYILLGFAVILDSAMHYLIELGRHATDIWNLGTGKKNPVRERRRAKNARNRAALSERFKGLVRESGDRPKGPVWGIPARFTKLGDDTGRRDLSSRGSDGNHQQLQLADIAYVDNDAQ